MPRATSLNPPMPPRTGPPWAKFSGSGPRAPVRVIKALRAVQRPKPLPSSRKHVVIARLPARVTIRDTKPTLLARTHARTNNNRTIIPIKQSHRRRIRQSRNRRIPSSRLPRRNLTSTCLKRTYRATRPTSHHAQTKTPPIPHQDPRPPKGYPTAGQTYIRLRIASSSHHSASRRTLQLSLVPRPRPNARNHLLKSRIAIPRHQTASGPG
jgi:hypothetical protein